jgi:Cysteine-rich secretory protein family
MIHKPIAIMMILPIFVAGILMLGILAPTARGADDNAGGGETAPAAPPPATETPPPVAAPPASASQVSNNTDFVNTVLEMQNRKRAAVGVPPLMWSNTLAAGAQAWAEHQATINNSVHSPGNFKDYAENIAWRVHFGHTLPTMVQSWINEKSLYHGGPMPWVGVGGLITLRWSGGRRPRSVAVWRPAVSMSFWCAATPRLATSSGSQRIRRASFLSR